MARQPHVSRLTPDGASRARRRSSAAMARSLDARASAGAVSIGARSSSMQLRNGVVSARWATAVAEGRRSFLGS